MCASVVFSIFIHSEPSPWSNVRTFHPPERFPPSPDPFPHHGEADGIVIHSESGDQVIWEGGRKMREGDE